jgi:dTDP-4-dehydrorhamnose 3,5-epimerase
MNVIETPLPGVLVFEPSVFEDPRGYFLETFHKQKYLDAGLEACFVQDNVSVSSHGTLRGLHYQHPKGQGKLVQVLEGSVFDVAVDIRSDSPTFGRWYGVTLTAEKHNQMYIPAGFAHGFYVLSRRALFHYKCTDYYRPETEGGIAWNDPDIGIEWPLEGQPVLSNKDSGFGKLAEVPVERLPRMEDYGWGP